MVAYKLSCKAANPHPLTGSCDHDPAAAMKLSSLFLRHGKKAAQAFNKITGGKDFPVDEDMVKTMNLLLGNDGKKKEQQKETRGEEGKPAPDLISIEGERLDLLGGRRWAEALKQEPLAEGIVFEKPRLKKQATFSARS